MGNFKNLVVFVNFIELFVFLCDLSLCNQSIFIKKLQKSRQMFESHLFMQVQLTLTKRPLSSPPPEFL